MILTGELTMRYFVVLTALLFAVGPALAQPPKGSPPTFKVVDGTDPKTGKILFKEIRHQVVQVIEKRQVLENGKNVIVDVAVNKFVPVEYTSIIEANKCQIITPDGKQLPIDQVWKRVKAKSVVVVSGTGQTPGEAYLRLLAADTIVIIPDLLAPKKN